MTDDISSASPVDGLHRRPVSNAALSIAYLAALCVLIFWLLGGPGRDFRVPIRFGVDSLAYLTQTKTTIDTGWWWSNPRLSAPSTIECAPVPVQQHRGPGAGLAGVRVLE